MHIIREVFPNGMPLVVDAVHEGGIIDPNSIKVYPVIGNAHDDSLYIGEVLPWKASKLVKRLNIILKYK